MTDAGPTAWSSQGTSSHGTLDQLDVQGELFANDHERGLRHGGPALNPEKVLVAWTSLSRKYSRSRNWLVLSPEGQIDNITRRRSHQFSSWSCLCLLWSCMLASLCHHNPCDPLYLLTHGVLAIKLMDAIQIPTQFLTTPFSPLNFWRWIEYAHHAFWSCFVSKLAALINHSDSLWRVRVWGCSKNYASVASLNLVSTSLYLGYIEKQKYLGEHIFRS